MRQGRRIGSLEQNRWSHSDLGAGDIGCSQDDGEKLIKDSDCSSCHAVDRQVVGPAYSRHRQTLCRTNRRG